MVLCTCVDGRILLPDFARRALGLLPGDPVLLRPDGDALVVSRVTPRRDAHARRRARPARIVPLRRTVPAGQRAH
jgi:bifunctional DNA-binding transcriptional regulator/antitoxin component of YhaV-PrlF toxin-antitoxin module